MYPPTTEPGWVSRRRGLVVPSFRSVREGVGTDRVAASASNSTGGRSPRLSWRRSVLNRRRKPLRRDVDEVGVRHENGAGDSQKPDLREGKFVCARRQGRQGLRLDGRGHWLQSAVESERHGVQQRQRRDRRRGQHNACAVVQGRRALNEYAAYVRAGDRGRGPQPTRPALERKLCREADLTA